MRSRFPAKDGDLHGIASAGGLFLASLDPAEVFGPNVNLFGELRSAHLAILASCPEELTEKFRFSHPRLA